VTEVVALDYNGPIKTKKHDIGTEEESKMVIIGDYWDIETFTQVVDLLKEYEDFFPHIFLKLKELKGHWGP
jgi:hypothetical protein